jgi:hypothetical protein
MGDITGMILDGILCEQCGVFIDEDYGGFPRNCDDCKSAKEQDLEERENYYKRQNFRD